MSTVIKYNGSNVFAGQPTPFLAFSSDSISTDGGVRVAQQNQISLNGQITGINFNTIVAKSEEIARAFATGFKTLEVEEEFSDVIVFSGCRVESINFQENTFARVVDYSINLSNYDNFSGTVGVINPQETFNFQMNEDGTSTVTHEVSAEGVSHNGQNPFNNAKNYVAGLTGWRGVITPQFVNSGDTVYPILTTTSENINRVNSTYGITENYIFTDGASSYTPVTTISVDRSSSIEQDFDTISVNATVKGGQYFTTGEVVAHATGLNLYAEAASLGKVSNLLNNPLSFSLNQNVNENSVTINAVYDNDTLFAGGNAYFDYTIGFNTDNVIGITTATIDGNIIGRTNSAQKLAFAEEFLTGTIENSDYLYEKTNEIYTQIYGTTFPLRVGMDNFSVNKNPNTAEISVSASFTNKDYFRNNTTNGNIFSEASYSVDVSPSIPQLRPSQHILQNGYYTVVDLNAPNRENVNINVNINYNNIGLDNGQTNRIKVISDTNTASEKFFAEQLGNNLLDNIGFRYLNYNNDTLLMSENISYFEQRRTFTASQTYSQEGTNPTYNTGVYHHIQF